MDVASESRTSTGAPLTGRSPIGMIGAVVVIGLAASIGGLISGTIAATVTAAVIALVVVIVIGLSTRVFGYRWLVASTASRPLVEGEHPRLANLIDGLGLAAGVDPPDVRVVDDDAMNAAVVATRPGSATIIVTGGLADGLDRIELEGVIGVLLARIRSGEAERSARIALRLGAPVLLAGSLWRRLPGLGSAVLAVLGPIWGPIMRRAVPAETFIAADCAGALMTRYPPALIAAYEKIDRAATVTPAAVAGAAHLWIVNPMSGLASARAHRFSTHPPLDERIALLKEL